MILKIQKMIKILILTDDKVKWDRLLRKMMSFDNMYETKQYFSLKNQLFQFQIRDRLLESMRGAAYSHVILDKEIKDEQFYEVLMPTIKQRVTRYGLDKLFKS